MFDEYIGRIAYVYMDITHLILLYALYSVSKRNSFGQLPRIVEMLEVKRCDLCFEKPALTSDREVRQAAGSQLEVGHHLAVHPRDNEPESRS